MRVLMMGLTPPLEGGSQRHIYEISSRMKNCDALTQKGSICRNKIELPLIARPIFLRNIMFAILSRFYVLFLLLTLRKKYDIIHIHENLLYRCAIPLRWRYKVVVTVHGIKGFKFYDNKFLWFFFKQGLKFADKIISVSLADKELLDKDFNNVVYVPNGVNIETYKGLKRKVERKITFVGRIHEQKGIVYLLKAFEIIKDRYPEYRLEIIGKKEGEIYERLSREFGNERIIWKGFILDRKKLFSEILSSEILVYPSLWEALPWPALLEGLASGKPVIASNLNGMSKIFTDEENIVLFEPGNSEELAKLISRLIEQKEKAKRMGAEGKKLAKNYSWDKIAKEITKVCAK
jgi:phosphatidylinositol alpha-mannosyltransferase